MATIAEARTATTATLEQIHVSQNVRSLNAEHVDALVASIELLGVLVPVVVAPATGEIAAGGWEHELVAGFHRVAAAARLKLREIPIVVRAIETEDADRGAENIVRAALTPYEEARAVEAMLANGLSEDGTAQALGWPKARVTARVRLLGLPERAREMVGARTIPLTRSIGCFRSARSRRSCCTR